jgi:hypothetical protein
VEKPKFMKKYPSINKITESIESFDNIINKMILFSQSPKLISNCSLFTLSISITVFFVAINII